MSTENDTAWPAVSLVVLNWNGRQLLEMCLPSLANVDYPHCEIILVDNGSTDDSVTFVREHFPQVVIVANEENLGFSKGMNVGLRQAQGSVVVLVNNDVVVRPNWLRALVRPLTTDDTVGITGCKLLFPDGQTIQHAGAELTYPLAHSHHYGYQETDEGQYDEPREVDYVTGAAMAIAHQVLDDVGLLDEGFAPFYFEDADFCYRVRAAGYRVMYVPEAVAIHHESASMRQVKYSRLYAFHKNRLRFVLKHYTTRQFLDDFIPAEMERLKEPASPEELRTVRRAYLETMLALPEMLSLRGEVDKAELFQAALEQLRETALGQRSTIYGSRPDAWYQEELMARRMLHEPTFSSDKPVIGPLIAAFREAWNNVSTKWYVRLILQQQVAFNTLAAELLDDLGDQARTNARDAALLARELAAMHRQFAELAAEVRDDLDELRQQLDRIEQMLEHDSDGDGDGDGDGDSDEE